MNKTLKILTVGALALTGSLAFSGCMADDAKITADEKTQIMTTVENGNKFMENLYSAAQEENEILKQQLAEEKFKNATQNALLEEKNKLLEKELEETKANNAAQNEILEEKNAILQDKNDLLEEELEETKANNEIQNSILQEKNDLLEKQLEEERANNKLQNAELLKKEAHNTLLLALTRMQYNFDGVRNNMRFTQSVSDQNMGGVLDTVTLSNGQIIMTAEMPYLNEQENPPKYDKSGQITYTKDQFLIQADYGIDFEGNVEMENEGYIGFLGLDHTSTLFFNMAMYDTFLSYKLEDFTSVKVNEKGNYVLTVIKRDKETDCSEFYEVEVTKDAILISEKYYSKSTNMENMYEYDVVDESRLLALAEKADKLNLKPALNGSQLRINSPRQSTEDPNPSVGGYISDFNLEYYYKEDGEIKIKTWENYNAFVADGGTCEGFSVEYAGRSTAYFKYNGCTAYVDYTVLPTTPQQ